ncbi:MULTISPECIES: Flp family type IVb pilin [Ponticoccus]|uniref:Flp pilus assembly pilin Flp n=1 Tax=Ponticoccus litoralis TaxID=422297 RepID=A0AAW9SS75_9RHOB
MCNRLSTFSNEEDGAVTVDWVVLTAAMIGLCIAAYTAIETSTLGLRDAVATELTEQNNF